MDNFIPARKVKHTRPAESYSVSCCGHCPMDVIIEELCTFPDVNVLVVGVGECVYYAAKQPFRSGCRSWGFELTDQEIIFGSTDELEHALTEIADNGFLTICIMTCIPSMMDIQPEERIAQNEHIIVIGAPDYSHPLSGDIRGELYQKIGEKLSLQDGPPQIWDEVGSISQLREKLTRAIHVVNNKKFLGLLRQFESDGITMIDNTVFHSLDFYEQNRALLDIPSEKIHQLRTIVHRLGQSEAPLHIKSRHAVSLANFFAQERISVAYAVADGADQTQAAACVRAQETLKVSLDWATPLPEGNNLELIFRGENENFDTLYQLLWEADQLWD